MRQVARRLRDGRLEVVAVPDPAPAPGTVAVAVEASVISAGTERATLEVARKSLLGKARARPDQARQVIERARREGVGPTLQLVRQRLDELGPLGYSAAGTVVEVGPGARGVAPGDRVAIAGAGSANHAEVDIVPSLLCARVPDGVRTDHAAFATLGAIAMNGFRRADAAVGATVVVVGLGIIGQLAVRIALAAGCRVVAVDLDPHAVELARGAGAEAHERSALDSRGDLDGSADAILLCAATQSSDPVELAGRLARDRAPVVVVGDVGMDVPREPFYMKELDLRLSRSYGPGRYDPNYERWGIDYPIGYVRWTEQRNMQAFLDLVARGLIDLDPVITHRFPFSEAERAFAALETERSLVGVVLEYERDGRPGAADEPRERRAVARKPGGAPRFGLIGAGNFATGTILPRLTGAGVEPVVVATASGLSAESARSRFGFAEASADPDEVIARDDLDLVVIATRHDSHARLAAAALRAGRAVYVEKPLALDAEGLEEVRAALAESDAPLFVGFNRRYAPNAVELREALAGPKTMHFRVNAGRLPDGHWLNDPREGGGRLLGEGCHFVDFLCDQAGGDPRTAYAQGYPSRPGLPREATDNFVVQVAFSDGSVGSVTYAADAPTEAGKERFEASAGGSYGVIEDFADGRLQRGARTDRLRHGRQDKGFDAQFEHIAAVLRGERAAPDPDSYVVSTLATLAAARSLGSGQPEPVIDATGA